jgi:hypothetical protein
LEHKKSLSGKIDGVRKRESRSPRFSKWNYERKMRGKILTEDAHRYP